MLRGELDEAGCAALAAQLDADADKRRLYVQLAMQTQLIGEALLLHPADADESFDPYSAEIMMELIQSAKMHKCADEITQERSEESTRLKAKENREHRERLRLAQQTDPRSKQRVIVIPKLIAALGIAAAIGLVAWLGWSGVSNPQADQQTGRNSSDQSQVFFAAKISNLSHARWAGGSQYAVGADLPPGELSLTHGQATIVFGNGAVVVLQSPVRFSLIDGTAGRLHRGTLSAIVPESGHGFEVFVPGGVVTDLGTAFDVAVGEDNQPSRVEVTQGRVKIAPIRLGQRGEPVLLVQEQFADVDSAGMGIEAYAYVDERVELTAPTTGLGIARGDADPAWTVKGASQSRENPCYVVNASTGIWLLGDRAASQWISYRAAPGVRPIESHVFQTRFVIPEGIDPQTVKLNLRYIADDELLAIRINGDKVAENFGVPRPDLGRLDHMQLQVWSQAEVTQGFKPGMNIISFEIYNGRDRVGFRAELACTGVRRFVPLDNENRSEN